MKQGKLWGMLLLIAVVIAGCNKKDYQYAEGRIYGTFYHISYDYDQDLSPAIVGQMELVNKSLSMFNKNSVIARVNRGETDTVDALFIRLFREAEIVNKETDGAFDITVAPLSNAWGFGYKHDSFPTPEKIDSLLLRVGMGKLKLEGDRLTKSIPGVEMDASSIAKGLGVDLVADYFDSLKISNYMVEIGGEVRVKGMSSKSRAWRIAIDKPIDDPEAENRELQMVVGITDGALATSGNYRNFYIRDGKKYAHTLNPKTGYPVQQDILSSSVYAPTCMEADAYATAFMVLGLEKSRAVVEKNPELEACFIYNANDSMKVWMTPGFQKLVIKE